MKPQAYTRLLQRVQLQSLLLDALEAEVRREVFDPTVQPRVQVDLSDRVVFPDEEHFEVLSTLTFVARIRRRVWVRVRLRFRARYTLPSRQPPEAFFQIFRETSARLHVWPYFREALSNTLVRMGLPPFPLPLYIPQETNGQT